MNTVNIQFSICKNVIAIIELHTGEAINFSLAFKLEFGTSQLSVNM